MSPRLRPRIVAAALALAATGALSGCYAGYGGSAGYGGHTRGGGGYSGSIGYCKGGASGGVEEFVMYAGLYAGAALITGAIELIERCHAYHTDWRH